VPIGRVIPGVLAEVIRKAPLCDEKVAFAWGDAVGEALTRVTRIRLDKTGVLHVTAEGTWGREIQRLSPLILRRLERLLGPGTVKAIQLV
jgi:hypothetical protein